MKTKTEACKIFIFDKIRAGVSIAEAVREAKKVFENGRFRIHDSVDDQSGKSWFAIYPRGYGGKRGYTSRLF